HEHEILEVQHEAAIRLPLNQNGIEALHDTNDILSLLNQEQALIRNVVNRDDLLNAANGCKTLPKSRIIVGRFVVIVEVRVPVQTGVELPGSEVIASSLRCLLHLKDIINRVLRNPTSSSRQS